MEDIDPESEIAQDIALYGCAWVRVTAEDVERIDPKDILRAVKDFLEMQTKARH